MIGFLSLDFVLGFVPSLSWQIIVFAIDHLCCLDSKEWRLVCFCNKCMQVSRFSAEISELLPSLLSSTHWGAPAVELPAAQAVAVPLGASVGVAASSAAVLSGVWVEAAVADGSRDACAHVIVVNTGCGHNAFWNDF